MEKKEIGSNLSEGTEKQQSVNVDDLGESSKIYGSKEPSWQEDQDVKGEGKLLNTRLIALFVIGILVGITLKTHAVKSLTMGFEDYKLSKYVNDFRLDEASLERERGDQGSEEDTDIPSDGDSAEPQEVDN